ncbi:MAG TPA: hypothetical protein DDY12_05730 [Porphyromonadaceae bacterium]|nr:hypothetical protein [Porphyromonadaceae bacterium]
MGFLSNLLDALTADGGDVCSVSDSDVPSGSGGINREGYSYGQLRRCPIIPEVLRGISNSVARQWAEECNRRNSSGFVMRRVDGEYCFDGLHVGPKVKLPSPDEIRRRLGRSLTAEAVREVSYGLLREEIARQTGLSVSQSASIIGAMLDCVPHEDISGYVYMVPNWAHRWFRHRGYVSRVLS